MNPIQLPLHSAECWLLENFLSDLEANAILEQLLVEIDWKQDEIFMFGRQVKIPRLQNFMADPGVQYTYSGLKMIGCNWHPSIAMIKKRIEEYSGHTFNAALLNLYRNGNDSMGWHQDNEAELGPDPIVASLSIGAERRFLFREKKRTSNIQEVILPSGSLLWMGHGVQKNWQHSLPKTKRCQSNRINITFRQIQKEAHSS
ncbi:MAG: alpha-ketoglutarate-dependent dioxygenase AlkB family protein [Neptuniibacter sp.]